MNTHAEYRRHVGQSPETKAVPVGDLSSSDEISALARHGDPSLGRDALATPAGKRIAWVRPTELHSYAGDLIGRGIDLQAELARRTARTPHTLTRSVRRAAPPIARRGPSTSANQEGLQL